MLDDFKTEIGKLSVKRRRKEEQHRNHIALVLEEDQRKADQDQLEFTTSFDINAICRTDDSATNKNDNARQPADKQMVGRMGTKIWRLPSLQNFPNETAGRRDAEEEILA